MTKDRATKIPFLNIYLPVLTVLFLFFIVPEVFPKLKGFQTFDDSKKNVGIFLDDPKEFKKFDSHPDIIGWFEPWYQPLNTAKLDICNASRYAIPFITWEPFTVKLNEISSGQWDEYIRSFLQSVTDHTPNTEVLLRFAHEMETRPKYKYTWYAWQSEKDPEAYIRAWRHVVTLGREIAPNIKWVWSPNRADEYSDPFYPGDEYVDYVGLTLNLRQDADYYSLYKNFRDFYVMEGTRENLEHYGKRIIISETGYSNPDIQKRQAFLRSTFDYLLEDPNIAGIVFFNGSITTERDYNLTQKPELMQEFNNGLKRIHSFRSAQGQP